MPVTAFGTAMMDGVNAILEHKQIMPVDIYSLANLRSHDLNHGIRYSLSMNHQSLEMPISDFLHLPKVDIDAISRLKIPKDGRVADLGCGIGRHLAIIRHNYPEVECCGVEHCDLQRGFAEEHFPGPQTFVSNLTDLQGEFDAVFMLGNGLGIFGDEEGILAGLREWGNRIKLGGYFAIETGAMSGDVDRLTISTWYGRIVDEPFDWYGFSRSRLVKALENVNEDGTTFEVKTVSSRHGCFIALARKKSA